MHASWPELDTTFEEQLASGCARLGLELTADTQARLLDYLQLMVKWNRAYNLTAVRDPAQMVTRHLLDSLAIAPYLRGQRLLDVGTGGGLPGVPMAIVFHSANFTCWTAMARKHASCFR